MGEAEQSLTWRLSDPGMGLLERAGLAALYMSLRAADGQHADLSPLRWAESDLTPQSVSIRWTGPAKAAFAELFKFAWRVQDGVLYLPAVHSGRELSHFHLRVPMHNGIMRTFFQHPNVQPKLEEVARLVALDDDKQVTFRYEPPAERVDDPARGVNPKTNRLHKTKVPSARLTPHKDLAQLFDRNGNLEQAPVELSNWVYPGIAPRFGDEVAWRGPAGTTLLLMLAPIACLYQQLHSEFGTWLLVVPGVTDLEEFHGRRRALKLDPAFTDVASLSDAGMQFLADFCWQPNRRDLAIGCQVVAMGQVKYYKGQNIRRGVVDVSPTPLSLKRYRILHRILENRYVPPKTEEETAAAADNEAKPKRRSSKPKKAAHTERAAGGWFRVPSGRGRVADNLVDGRPWYADLFEPFPWDLKALDNQRKRNPGLSIERLWFRSLAYQRGKLMELIQEKEMWDSDAERMFVEAFWQILAALYRQEADAVQRGGSREAKERLEDLNEDLRRRLTRAKTRDLLREVVADLITRPVSKYRSPLIAERPDLIWSLINDPYDWKRARDLSLLALASYMNKHKRAAGGDAPAADTESTDEGEV